MGQSPRSRKAINPKWAHRTVVSGDREVSPVRDFARQADVSVSAAEEFVLNGGNNTREDGTAIIGNDGKAEALADALKNDGVIQQLQAQLGG